MPTLLKQNEVRRLLGNVSPMTMHRWRKAGILPQPVVINGRNYWPENVIAAVIADRSAGGAK